MRLDGFGLFVQDMAKMIRFYRDVLRFEIKEGEDTSNVYLIKDDTLFLLYGRKDFEKMTSWKYEYIKGINGHTEIALYVDTFEEVDAEYENAVNKGAVSILAPETEIYTNSVNICITKNNIWVFFVIHFFYNLLCFTELYSAGLRPNCLRKALAKRLALLNPTISAIWVIE